MSDERSAGQQVRDVFGLFTGRTKIQGNQIVPRVKQAPAPEPTPEPDVKVDVTVAVDDDR